MFNFHTFPALDVGYYTAQPATVEQVQHLFRHVRLLRDELGLFMKEVSQYPDKLDDVENTLQTYKTRLKDIEKRLTEAETQGAIFNETLEEFTDEIDQLTEALRDIQRTAVATITTAGEGGQLTVTLASATGETLAEHTFKFTPGDVATTIAKDGQTIEQTVPALHGETHARLWTLSQDDAGVHLLYDGAVVYTLDAHPSGADGVDQSETVTAWLSIDGQTVTLEVDSSRADELIDTLRHDLDVLGFEAVRSVTLSGSVRSDNKTADIILTTESNKTTKENLVEIQAGDFISFQPVDNEGFIINTDNQLDNIQPFIVDRVKIAPYSLTTYSQEFNKQQNKYGLGDPFNKTEIKLKQHSEYGLINVDWSNDSITLNDENIILTLDELTKRYQEFIQQQDEKIKELEARLESLEKMRVDSITGARIKAEPVTHDSLGITLETFMTDGTTEETSAIIKLTNGDHSLRYTTADGAQPNACIVTINHDKKWLTRQGLDPDMDTI